MSKQTLQSARVVKYAKYRLIDFHTYDEEETPMQQLETEPERLDQHGNPIKKRAMQNFVIQMFGIDKNGKTASIYVKDYKPFFFIKVLPFWNEGTVLELKKDILQKIGKYNEKNIIEMRLVDYNKLYGFTAGKTSKFVQITFKNMGTFNQVKNCWYTNMQDGTRKMMPYIFQRTRLELYESSIPPLLRYFHIHNISPSGWVLVKKAEEQFGMSGTSGTGEKTTTCTKEYICKWKDVEALPNEESRVPYKICSFDIEASSSHGDFPLPIKTYKRLATHIVDYFYQKNGYMANMTQTEIEELFQKLVLSAFEICEPVEGIDCVYPKEQVSEDYIKMIIDAMLSNKMDDEDVITSKSKKLAIADNCLTKINDFFANMAGDADAEADAEPNETNEEEPEDPTTDFGQEYIYDEECGGNGDDPPHASMHHPQKSALKRPNSPKKKVSYADETYNIIKWLVENSSIDRDTKIEKLNTQMTLYLPDLEGDKVTFIGSTFMKYGEKSPYLNHCIVLGTCDEVEGATIECMETERDLLVRWTELIQEENPDIIIGYNIFGFDYEFMFRRAEENDCVHEFFDLSRRSGELCYKKTKEGENMIETTKIMLATGEYNLRYIKMAGRIQIDMYTYFRREFNLASYKLDDVASQNISDDVKKCELITDAETGEQYTYLYSSNLTGLNIGDYIHIELSGFSSDYYKDGKKFKVVDIKKEQAPAQPAKGKLLNIIVIAGHEDLNNGNKSIKWGMAKDDVSPQDIFRLTNGTSADRAIVAKYCIQDCNLVHHLMNKIDVITGFVEMARICSVPISYLIFRGQGIKLTSFVAKKCREKQTLMPDLDKSGSNEGYEGAIVLPPKCSMYMDNPVACVDYSSLYPSSMISNNLSHDSKVWTKEYDLNGVLLKETGEKDRNGNYLFDNLPDYQYINIEFDTYRYIRKTPTTRAIKTKVGKMICRWAQFPNGKKAIMPSILEELLKARSDTRKIAKQEDDPFMANILDKRQLGYKVTANSLYGQCGAKTSTFYEKDVAASTTATGRLMITYARRIIEEVYGDLEYETEGHGTVLTKAEYVYGDSVASYTPVYVRIDGVVDICTIEELATKYGGGVWRKCMEEGKQEKEVCELSAPANTSTPAQLKIETWTEKGWTPLYRIIRHMLAPHKQMVRVMTETGCVDVTDDHSLLLSSGKEISPKNASVGDSLMHHSINKYHLMPSQYEHGTLIKERMFVNLVNATKYCLFVESCDHKYKLDYFISKNGQTVYKVILNGKKEEPPSPTELRRSSRVPPPPLTPLSQIEHTLPKQNDAITEHNDYPEVVPTLIRGSFVFRGEEYQDEKEEKEKSFWNELFMFSYNNSASSSSSSVGSEYTEHDTSTLTQLSLEFPSTQPPSQLPPLLPPLRRTQLENEANKIVRIENIPYSGYVYDLTTENHHFGAGIGNMIVHNTDSVFFTFNLQDPKTGEKIVGQKALEITIEIAQDASHLCTKYLKPPMELSYEKTLMPFILLSKKRYVGMLYETDPKKGKLKYMGLSLKRRDSCDYVKDTYGGILNILMKENNVQKAIHYLDDCVSQLLNGNVNIEKLMLTKALKSYYKNPQQISHSVLAERMGKRDPGNKPKAGDRIKFVFINNERGKLLGDRIETPEYIKANRIGIDYAYYITNQLMNPLQQLFGLALEQIWEADGKLQAIREYKREMAKMAKEYPDLELFMKKKEKFCSTKIKSILFDKHLMEINNKKKGMKQITSFFMPKGV